MGKFVWIFVMTLIVGLTLMGAECELLDEGDVVISKEGDDVTIAQVTDTPIEGEAIAQVTIASPTPELIEGSRASVATVTPTPTRTPTPSPTVSPTPAPTEDPADRAMLEGKIEELRGVINTVEIGFGGYCTRPSGQDLSHYVYSPVTFDDTLAELEEVAGELAQVVTQCIDQKKQAIGGMVEQLRTERDIHQRGMVGHCDVQHHFSEFGGEAYSVLYGEPNVQEILDGTYGQSLEDYPAFMQIRSELVNLTGLCSQLPVVHHGLVLGSGSDSVSYGFYLQGGRTLTYTLESIQLTAPPVCQGQMNLVADDVWDLEYGVYQDQVKEVYVPAGSTLCVDYYHDHDSELWFDNGQERIQLRRGSEDITFDGLGEGTYRFTVGTDYYRVGINQHKAGIGFRVRVGTPKPLTLDEVLVISLSEPEGRTQRLSLTDGVVSVRRSGYHDVSIQLTDEARASGWKAHISSLSLES